MVSISGCDIMSKQLIINSCEDCPYVRPIQFDMAYNDDTPIMYFKCGHKKFPFGRSNWAIKDQIIYDCPLEDAADESCIGDLTPDDIEHIVDIARRIKNAKNVREGRYG